MGGDSVQAQLFLYLAPDGFIRGFPLFQKAGDQAIHLLWPAFITSQDDHPVEFDDGGNHRHGIVPVDITATGGHAALPGTAMDVGRVEWLAALRAKVDRHRKYP